MNSFHTSTQYSPLSALLYKLTMKPKALSFKYRIVLLVAMLVIVPLGYWIRFAGDTWLNDFCGSVAYEIFWVLLVVCLFPNVSLAWTAIGVCVATCILEFLQLWQNPFYLAAKSTFVGRLVLGNTFAWSDFPSYVVGSVAGWAVGRPLLKIVRRSFQPVPESALPMNQLDSEV